MGLLKTEVPADIKENLKQLLNGDFHDLLADMNKLGQEIIDGIGTTENEQIQDEPIVEDPGLEVDVGDNVLTPDNEFDNTADYPGKHGERMNPESAGFMVNPGSGIAKSPVKPQEDVPLEMDPCVMSTVTPLEEACEGFICPEFEEHDVEGACGFEMRTYRRGFWATTPLDLTAENMDKARANSASRLLGYLGANTVEGAVLSETRPFRVSYQLADTGVPESGTMMLYLPSAPHPGTPHPGVEVLVLPEHTLYLRGFSEGTDYRTELELLEAALRGQGVREAGYLPAEPLVVDYDVDFGSNSSQKRQEVAFQAITKSYV